MKGGVAGMAGLVPACRSGGRALAFVIFALAAASPVARANETKGAFADPSRIASIGGSVTEIAFALGEADKLVARDSTSVYPQEALKLPDVGYMRQLSPEGVLSVHPSGILALQGSGPKEAVDVLKKAEVPYIEVAEAYDHEGVLAKIRLVGQALGADAAAEALARQVDGKLKAVEAQTAAISDRKRVLFVLSVQQGKVMASGIGTTADGMIRLSGAVNAIDGFHGYRPLADEAIINARPDAILLMSNAGPGPSDADLLGIPALAATPAGQQKAIIRMDAGYLLGFGPRTADAAHDLARQLYGKAIGD